MSQIFDALQRSEAENSGTDVSALKEATNLLLRTERRTASSWVTGSSAESAPAVHDEASGALGAASSAAAAMEAMPEFRLALAELRTAPSESRSEAAEYESEPAEPTPYSAEYMAAPAQERPAPPEIAVDDPGTFQTIGIPDTSLGRLVCFTERQSGAAEAFRLLGVRLRHMRRDRPLKRVLITSTIPQEGKSLVSANLACTLALTTKQKTLLIEGDVRRPSLTKLLGLGKKSGLCDWLRGERSLTGCIYHLDGPDFHILPAGSAPTNPLELLQSGMLSTMVDQLANWFEWIIIDTPPVLPLADTSVWTRLADGILLVTRQGITQKKQLKRGVEAIEQKKLIGALVNSSNTAGQSDYYYQPSSGSA